MIISRLTNQLREQSAVIATRAATHQQVRRLAEAWVRDNDGNNEHRYELAKLGSSRKLPGLSVQKMPCFPVDSGFRVLWAIYSFFLQAHHFIISAWIFYQSRGNPQVKFPSLMQEKWDYWGNIWYFHSSRLSKVPYLQNILNLFFFLNANSHIDCFKRQIQ